MSTCSGGDIRLIGGSDIYDGRVEVCVGGAWGTVCDDLWGTNDAVVVCRQLGYSTSNVIARTMAFFGQGTVDILLDDVQCTGSESMLLDCTHLTVDNCAHSEDAGVDCQGEYLHAALN